MCSKLRIDDTSVMPLISVTRLRIRSWRFFPAFLLFAIRSSRQAQRSPGNLGVGALNDAKKVFWTRTAWEDDAAMKSYMLTKPHLDAMKKLPHWCDEAAVVHWTQEDARLPDWIEAHRRLKADGRRSKVTFASADHEAFVITPPRS